ncbi:MAG TPA: Holliday junction resolvase RuvX [Acidimicrobiales bacterium]|nr:Holliday junction resolvase RuvX [Acidimicrobiales bacterium]
MGIDLGERRIGVAVSDSRGVLATPYTVVERSGDAARDRQVVAGLVTEVGGEILVVGMPLSLSGAKGQAARAAEAEVAAFREVVGVPVVTFDERLTTVQAARLRRDRAVAAGRQASRDRRSSTAGGPRARRAAWMTEAGGRAGSRSDPRSANRQGIDAEAAAVMLAAWLEGR